MKQLNLVNHSPPTLDFQLFSTLVYLKNLSFKKFHEKEFLDFFFSLNSSSLLFFCSAKIERLHQFTIDLEPFPLNLIIRLRPDAINISDPITFTVH